MGFLDNSSITVDAILTKRGRQILANGGDLGITKFALSDEEVDYTLYDVTHPNGTDSYGAVIENMSLLEATPSRTTFRSFLVDVPVSGMTLNVGPLDLGVLGKNEPISINPETVGGLTEQYEFTIENTNIVMFNGGLASVRTASSVQLSTQSINIKAATTITVKGLSSGLVKVINLTVEADPGSGTDPLGPLATDAGGAGMASGAGPYG